MHAKDSDMSEREQYDRLYVKESFTEYVRLQQLFGVNFTNTLEESR